jgi:hypothetical protein
MSDTPRITDSISNQTVLIITGCSIIGCGVTLDWNLWGLAAALAVISAFGVGLLSDRHYRGAFR